MLKIILKHYKWLQSSMYGVKAKRIKWFAKCKKQEQISCKVQSGIKNPECSAIIFLPYECNDAIIIVVVLNTNGTTNKFLLPFFFWFWNCMKLKILWQICGKMFYKHKIEILPSGNVWENFSLLIGWNFIIKILLPFFPSFLSMFRFHGTKIHFHSNPPIEK